MAHFVVPVGFMLRKNTTVYKATGKGNEYEKCGRLRLKTKDPELRIDRLKDIPEGWIAVEVDQAVAKKLFGQTIAIHCYDNTVEHTVGTVNWPVLVQGRYRHSGR